MYHPTILFIAAVRTVQLSITSYMGWNKGLVIKLYKHKHEIYILTSYICWNKGLVVKLYKHKYEIIEIFSFVGIIIYYSPLFHGNAVSIWASKLQDWIAGVQGQIGQINLKLRVGDDFGAQGRCYVKITPVDEHGLESL